MQVALSLAVFVGVYALIATDRIHRTLAALLGASAVLVLRILPQATAFALVDLNVIFLLLGTMIIANIVAKTGIFRWLAVEAVRRAEGSPYLLLVSTSLVTALLSAFLNNVTVVMLLLPITFFVADRLRISPVPFLVSQIVASNIGGAATLIGDPPNILIGTTLDRGFGEFVIALGPPAAVALLAYLALARWLFREDLRRAGGRLRRDEIDLLVAEERRIEDVPLMRISAVVLGLTVAGFVVARPLGLGDATIAITGAVVLLLAAREDVGEVLRDVEWATLFFFVGLFIVVGAVVRSGAPLAVGLLLRELFGSDAGVLAVVVLWVSAAVSAVADNIPFTIAALPVVREFGQTMPVDPLVWALSLGVNLGGNATIVGASANIVAAGMAEARGHRIGFAAYLRYGVPATLVTMIVATVDIWLRYLAFR
jgi:Na+/H+ antiporter NhaD/arsenite permease-like protein